MRAGSLISSLHPLRPIRLSFVPCALQSTRQVRARGREGRREGSLSSPEPFLVGPGDSGGGDLRACDQTAVNILGWSSVLLVTPSSGTGGAVPPTKKQTDGAWGLRSKLSVSSFLLVRAQGWEAGQAGQEGWRGHISPSVPPRAQRRGQGRRAVLGFEFEGQTLMSTYSLPP